MHLLTLKTYSGSRCPFRYCPLGVLNCKCGNAWQRFATALYGSARMDTDFRDSPATLLSMQCSSHMATTSRSQRFANGNVAISDDSPIFPRLE